MTTPKIIIGDTPLIVQEFSWSLTPGPQPNIQTFVVPKGDLNERLKAVINPTYLEMTVYGDTEGKFSQQTITFEKMYLIEPKEVDPYNVVWSIADVRWSWRGKKIYCSFNKTRIKNEKGISVSAPDTLPSSLRKQFDRFAIGRYLDWSVKADGKPYGMGEIVYKIFHDLGIEYRLSASQAGAYIIENVELEGVDIYRGLQYLLSKSRLQIGITRKGQAYVYSLDFWDESLPTQLMNVQQNRLVGPGTFYQQDLKRVRPRKITVQFQRKEETRLIASSSEDLQQNKPLSVSPNEPVWNQFDIDTWRVIGCENVLPIPYPVTISGREYNIGEYVPIWQYLTALQVSDTEIRENWWGGRLERRITAKYDHGIYDMATEQFIHQLISVIRTHYRQTYRIDPYYMDRIRSWETRRVSVINNYDHFSPPSPCWIDYCVIPKLRHPAIAKRRTLAGTHAYNWIVSERDQYRNQPTVHSISVVDQALGVFRITKPALVDQVIREIFPSALDPLPVISLTQNIALWAQCHLRQNHTMETIVSIVWDVDRDNQFGTRTKYFQIPLDYTKLGGIGPDIEYLSRLEYARLPAREIRVDEGITKLVADPTYEINFGILQALAQSEGAKLINQYKDRLSGYVRLAGFVDVELFSYMTSVTYHFGNRGLETIIDMRSTPPAPLLEEVLDQKQVDYIRRHVTRGDTANNIA